MCKSNVTNIIGIFIESYGNICISIIIMIVDNHLVIKLTLNIAVQSTLFEFIVYKYVL